MTGYERLFEVKIGAEARNEYGENAQMFIVSEMLKEARKKANMTQQKLVEREEKKLYFKN